MPPRTLRPRCPSQSRRLEGQWGGGGGHASSSPLSLSLFLSLSAWCTEGGRSDSHRTCTPAIFKRNIFFCNAVFGFFRHFSFSTLGLCSQCAPGNAAPCCRHSRERSTTDLWSLFLWIARDMYTFLILQQTLRSFTFHAVIFHAPPPSTHRCYCMFGNTQVRSLHSFVVYF